MECADIMKKAMRIAALGDLVATFDDIQERSDLIECFVSNGLITRQAGDLLLDSYVREAAE